MLARDLLQDGIVELAADERAERLYEDTMLPAIFNDRSLLTERVQLDLVHGRGHQTCFADLFEVLDATECIARAEISQVSWMREGGPIV